MLFRQKGNFKRSFVSEAQVRVLNHNAMFRESGVLSAEDRENLLSFAYI